MRNLIVFSVCLVFSTTLLGQSSENCPPSATKGVHVVQQGETLYAISRKYKISIADVMQWNNLTSDIMRPCMILTVSTPPTTAEKSKSDVPPSYNYTTKPQTTTPSVFTYQPDVKTHTIQAGESLIAIAEKYGFTTARLMAMNNIIEGQTLYVGQELKVNDCRCVDVQTITPYEKTSPTPTENFSEYKPMANVPQSYNQLPNQTGSPNLAYFKTSNFTPFYYIISTNGIGQGETPEYISNLFGLSANDVMMMNNLRSNAPLKIGQRLMLEDRNQLKPVSMTYETPSDNKPSAPSYIPSNAYDAPKKNTPPPPSTTANVTTMTSEEMQMVNEINLVRSNPTAYIPYIQQYMNESSFIRNSGSGIAAANELIAELQQMKPLNTLQTLQCIYNAARKHGEDERQRGSTDHVGSDGSHSWDRITARSWT